MAELDLLSGARPVLGRARRQFSWATVERTPCLMPEGCHLPDALLGAFCTASRNFMRFYLVHGAVERSQNIKRVESFVNCKAQCECEGLVQGNL